MLRATLARNAIALDAGGTIGTCERPDESPSCVRCEVATGMDGIDPDLVDRVAIAIAMYPPKFFAAAKIEHFALCRQLRLERADATADDHPHGLADPNTRRLMVSVEAFVDRDPGTYSIEQIVHHELFHLFDEARDEDTEWRGLKPPGFEYRDPARLTSDRPPGFVSNYATTNEREDRACVYEYLMSHADRLCEYANTDPILAAKTTLVWRRVAAVTTDAFMRRQAGCVDWVEIGPKPAPRPTRMRKP
jgi:hypothetical protein